MFENRVLRMILEPKGGRDIDWRKLLNEELHVSYTLPDIRVT